MDSHPMIGSNAGVIETTIFEQKDACGDVFGRVFVTDSGAVGIEYEGLVVIKTIKLWVQDGIGK